MVGAGSKCPEVNAVVRVWVPAALRRRRLVCAPYTLIFPMLKDQAPAHPQKQRPSSPSNAMPFPEYTIELFRIPLKSISLLSLLTTQNSAEAPSCESVRVSSQIPLLLPRHPLLQSSVSRASGRESKNANVECESKGWRTWQRKPKRCSRRTWVVVRNLKRRPSRNFRALLASALSIKLKFP